MNRTIHTSMLILTLLLFSNAWTFADEGSQGLEEGHGMHRGEKIARWMEDKGLSQTASVAAISTLPIVELRGAVPVGIVAFEMPWWKVYLVAVAGNMLPIPFILLLLGPVSKFLMRFPAGKKFFD